jgi:DNA polymerase III sliding clamp (beta) subunit (PCNA family)
MKKAMVIFIETDNEIEMKIEFEGEPDKNSFAHMAAAKAYQVMSKLLDEADKEEDDAGQQ